MKTLLIVAVVVLLPSPGFAQTAKPTTAADSTLATPAGHEVNFGLGHYNYVEPDRLKISIHGLEFSGEYTGTIQLDQRAHWFARVNARASFGNTSYNGWCAPWLITPDSASPNGYALDLGDYSVCDDGPNRDWYLETRGLVGKDFIGRSWAWSPEVGLGIRHLSNAISGISGFRTDKYLYIPMGITARTTAGRGALLGIQVEFDLLLRGWQTTRNSDLGSGLIPATTTAPAFTIDSFSDISFDQRKGWALRASAKYQINRSVLVEPYFSYWRVGDSAVNYGTIAFTVNGITAQQQLGFLEPFNTTREAGIKVGFRF